MQERFTIVGLGEALVDMLPQGQHVGGAPLNAAVMAQQLTAHLGGRGIPVSRVGQDAPGELILGHLAELGVDARYIQSDPDLRTGRVYVQLDDQQNPVYDIIENVAWDVIQFDPDLEELANDCDAVCYGTMAQRHPQSRQTIMRFLSQARRALRLFDVNLRQPWYDAASVQRGVEYATAVKLNQGELGTLTGLLGLDDTQGDDDAAATNLLQRHELKMVILTRGPQGTVIHTPQGRFEGRLPEPAEANPQANAIGAGDAVTAAIMVGACMRLPSQRLADMANLLGSWAASQPGATGRVPENILKNLFSDDTKAL